MPRRLAAGLIDVVLAGALFVALIAIGGAVPSLSRAFFLIATVVPLLYFVIAEIYYQTTPGKRLLGLTVVTLDGSKPDALAHIVRGMTRVPEALVLVPYLFVVPFSQRKQRFGDMVTETLVVRRSDLAGR
jgi:uncharacterized RDD family membrane protein YckC